MAQIKSGYEAVKEIDIGANDDRAVVDELGIFLRLELSRARAKGFNLGWGVTVTSQAPGFALAQLTVWKVESDG